MSCTRQRLQAYDVGTEFVLTVKNPAGELVTNLGDALSLEVQLGRPAGTTFRRPAELVTDGTDALLRYTTEGGDLDAAGTWKLQAIVGFPTGTVRTRILLFDVERNVSGAGLPSPLPVEILLEIPAISVA